MLFPNQIIPPAQDAYVASMKQYCTDLLYGTNTCSMTLMELAAQFLLLVGSANQAGTTTDVQMQCFLNLLQSQYTT